MLSQETLTQLLKICEDTKSAELTGHDNLVYDTITMDNFKSVVEFAVECIKLLDDFILTDPEKIYYKNPLKFHSEIKYLFDKYFE